MVRRNVVKMGRVGIPRAVEMLRTSSPVCRTVVVGWLVMGRRLVMRRLVVRRLVVRRVVRVRLRVLVHEEVP